MPWEEEQFCTFALQRDDSIIEKRKLITHHLWHRCVCSPMRSHPSVLLISATMKFNLPYLKWNGSDSPSLSPHSESNRRAAGSQTDPQNLCTSSKLWDAWAQLSDPDLNIWGRSKSQASSTVKKRGGGTFFSPCSPAHHFPEKIRIPGNGAIVQRDMSRDPFPFNTLVALTKDQIRL